VATRDYYVILGIPRSASGRSIRAAFHALAKKLHPDHAGPESAEAFQDVVEAYEVLSDPVRRREYNATLRVPWMAAEPLASPGPAWPAEPMVVEPEWVAPSFDSLFEVLFTNATGFGVPKSGRTEALHVDLALTAVEAQRGTVVPVVVQIPERCGLCGGFLLPFVCLWCEGQGRILVRKHMGIPIPSGVRTGEELDVSLREVGIRNVFLRLHVFVAE